MAFHSKRYLSAHFPLSVLFILAFAACKPNASEPSKGEGHDCLSFSDRRGANVVTIPAAGGQLFLEVGACSAWSVTIEGAEGISCSPSSGAAGHIPIVLTCLPNTAEERTARLIARLSSEKASVEIKVIQQGKPGSGSFLGEEHILGDITLLELPRLSGKASDYFITHRVESDNRVNFSLEYDVEAHHARWVCFSFDKVTASINTSRSDAWSWDPMVPSQYEVFRNDFESKSFARGHLIASHDRVFSPEANRQTFYYTNMSPQRHTFNEGIWLQMEQSVQSWGRSLKNDELLYVAKGGTIREEQIEGKRSNGRIVVPKYYWMALLKKSGERWHAVALLAEHAKPAKTPGRLLPYALSINELEEFTRLDFFFNLPDDIEEQVEKQAPEGNLIYWPAL